MKIVSASSMCLTASAAIRRFSGNHSEFPKREITLEPGGLHRIGNAVFAADETVCLEHLQVSTNSFH
jgi:hypothetical protein